MKWYLITFSIIFTACSSLSSFQEQPVIALNDNTYKTTCNGMAEAFDSCYRKAQKTCSNGYSIIDKTQLNDVIHREITFKCN